MSEVFAAAILSSAVLLPLTPFPSASGTPLQYHWYLNVSPASGAVLTPTLRLNTCPLANVCGCGCGSSSRPAPKSTNPKPSTLTPSPSTPLTFTRYCAKSSSFTPVISNSAAFTPTGSHWSPCIRLHSYFIGPDPYATTRKRPVPPTPTICVTGGTSNVTGYTTPTRVPRLSTCANTCRPAPLPTALSTRTAYTPLSATPSEPTLSLLPVCPAIANPLRTHW